MQAGLFYTMPIARLASPGAYLSMDDAEVLLPNRYVPEDAKPGDEVRVFVYHDSEDRLVATTLTPKVAVDEFAYLKVLTVGGNGAFLDWGLPKDLFLPRSQQREPHKPGNHCLIYCYRDEVSGRLAATEWYDAYLHSDATGLQEKQEVSALIVRTTPLGYVVIVDHSREGLIHRADAVVPLRVGQSISAFIKTIRPDGKLDLVPGRPGYQRTEGEAAQVLQKLQAAGGKLPYNDKSDPEDIYAYFAMSKKSFKMALGALYKMRKIELLEGGIRLLDDPAT